MNPGQLLTHFDRISEAPDAIPRLRRFILDLAVRGKLVEQDPRDEPASELLKRIQEEKAQSLKLRGVGEEVEPSKVEQAEFPFWIPPSWRWVHLIDVLIKLTDGTHHSPTNLSHGAFKYITAKNIKSEGVSLADISYVTAKVHHEIYSRCNPEKGDILYIKDGATTGIVTINDLDEPFSMLSSVALLKPSTSVYNRLIVEFLRSPFFYMQMRGFMKGAAITRVTLKRMAPALVPLPPLAEQHRIVAKVDELMALCDRLEAAQAERERRRDRLITAAHSSVSNSSSHIAHSTFFINHLPRLTTRPERIQQLRQTILSLAVSGKLVPQDSNDEPVNTALQRLELKGGNHKVRRGVPIHVPKPAFVEENTLPPGWAMESTARLLRLGAIQDLKDGNHGANHPKVSDFSQEGLSFITAAQVSNNGRIDYDGAHKLSGSPLAKIRVGFAKAGDLIYTHKGSVGRVALCDRDCILSPQTTYYRVNDVVLSNRYLRMFLLSQPFQQQVDEVKGQTTRDFVSIKTQYGFFIRVPPILEQHRIVAKVDELMALCDRLEAQLTITQSESHRLLEAVLHEALAPAA